MSNGHQFSRINKTYLHLRIDVPVGKPLLNKPHLIPLHLLYVGYSAWNNLLAHHYYIVHRILDLIVEEYQTMRIIFYRHGKPLQLLHFEQLYNLYASCWLKYQHIPL